MAGKIAGWVISGLLAAFLVLDGVIKLIKQASVVEAFMRIGWPIDLSVTLGVILLTCTLLFLIPKTAMLGGVLLTGYLGGAVATNLRLHNPMFSHTLFPVYFGVLVWVALRLRVAGLKGVFPLS
jgi:hypothetical protein